MWNYLDQAAGVGGVGGNTSTRLRRNAVAHIAVFLSFAGAQGRRAPLAV